MINWQWCPCASVWFRKEPAYERGSQVRPLPMYSMASFNQKDKSVAPHWVDLDGLLLSAEEKEITFVSIYRSEGNAQTIACFCHNTLQLLHTSLGHFPDHGNVQYLLSPFMILCSNFVLLFCMKPVFCFLSTDHPSAHLSNRKLLVKPENDFLVNITWHFSP